MAAPVTPRQNSNSLLLIATVVFVATGVAALLIGLFGSDKDERLLINRVKLKPERGTTFLERSNQKMAINNEVQIFIGDVVETNDIGRAWLDFGPQQGALLLQEDSQIELVSLNLGLMVRLIKGDIEVLNAPEKSRVVVQLPNSQIKKLSDIQLFRTTRNSVVTSSSDEQELTQDFLENSMMRLRPQILKCYSNYVADRVLKERIDILATISYAGTRGGAQNISLSSKTKLDEGLANCIKNSLKGLNLSPYKGPLIDIQLPIILE
jgi:hypothetical protein